MSIYKMSSQDYNNILKEANDKINRTTNEIKQIKKDSEKKLLITNYNIEYLSNKIDSFEHRNPTAENYVLIDENSTGQYDSYSNVVHASFKKRPVNVLNLSSVDNNSTIFRDEIKVKINDIENSYYKNIFKAENVKDKEIFFEEYSLTKEEELTNKKLLKIEIEVDKEKVIGTSKFNMIEIDPYLLGSFDISKIEIFGDDLNKPLHAVNPLLKVGKTRVVFENKFIFRKVVFYVELKYKSTSTLDYIFPFGLKHIFFLDADFRNDSYAIIKFESDKYIDHIKNDMKILTPFGFNESSIKEEGIKIYLENNNGILQVEQEATEGIRKPIARNLKTIWFKVPFQKIDGYEGVYNTTKIAYNFLIEYR